jgi:hypothetical protein
MDEKTELLISLGASTAANCVPCFDYYFKKAKSAGITMDEVRKTVELACKVKTGVGIFMMSSISDITGEDLDSEQKESARTNHPCCR